MREVEIKEQKVKNAVGKKIENIKNLHGYGVGRMIKDESMKILSGHEGFFQVTCAEKIVFDEEDGQYTFEGEIDKKATFGRLKGEDGVIKFVDDAINIIDEMAPFQHIAIKDPNEVPIVLVSDEIKILEPSYLNTNERHNDDHRFDEMLWSHGLLSGFSGGDTPEDALRKAAALQDNPDWHLSVSDIDQPIGPIGIIVKGEARIVSNIDLWTEICQDGSKRLREYSGRTEGIIQSLDDYTTEEWDHTEAVLANTEVCGVWVKTWALDSIFGDEFKVIAEKLQKKFDAHYTLHVGRR